MWLAIIGLVKSSRSPTPLARFTCRKNGWSNCSGVISSQTLSSFS